MAFAFEPTFPRMPPGRMPIPMLDRPAYSPTPRPMAPPPSAAPAQDDEDDSETLAELQQQYEDYCFNKIDEIKEKRLSRNYYHGNMWTATELKKLKARGQTKVTKNRIKKKINGIVGLIERLRQDPKAYPRGRDREDEAELATMCIRYVLDNNRWEGLSSRCAGDGGREGLGGLELGLSQTRNGDKDITLTRVATDTFFYDWRSFDSDFLDCTFMGTSKWCDLEIAKNLVKDQPEIADALDGLTGDGGSYNLDEDTERSVRWMTGAKKKRIRLVDHWHFSGGEWRWCLYTRGIVLMSGVSPFVDEEDKTICKFIMYSAYVDQDGDRYGFIRDMKDTQDEINHRYSKALHLLNTRRMMARRGSVDVEKTRQESIKADGVIEWDIEKPEFDDQKTLADMQGQLAFLEDNKKELEGFGPNPQLLGQAEQSSGRAIALLQQAGISELGPYIVDYKDWKLRVYRAVFYAVRKHWSKERWIRVTDPEGEVQMVEINKLMFDPISGQEQMVNGVAEMDVDIIIDEGSDTINMMQDAFDTLSTLASKGANVPPGLLIELAPIQASVKKKWLEKLDQDSQPDPMKDKLKQITLEGEEAKVAKTKSEAIKNAIGALKDAPLAFHPAMPQLDQHALSLADTLENEINPPPVDPAGGGAMPPGVGSSIAGLPPAPGGPPMPPGMPPPGALPPGAEPGLPPGV